MASRIAGITIEIGGDTTKLQSALKGVDKELSKTQSNLKDVNKLLKLDPGNTELLTQKQKNLEKAISQTSERLKQLKDAQKNVEQGSAEWESLQREIISTEQSLDGLKKEHKDFGNVASQQIKAAGKAMQEFGGKVEAAGKKMQPLSTAATGVLTALGGMAYKAVQDADDLNALAKQTGLTTAEIQKMQYAADLVDVSFSDIEGALKKMKPKMDENNATFQELGVSVVDANGELRDVNEVFYESIAALSQIENETERDQKAMELFGKGADSLAGIIDDGGAALKEYGKQAEELGVILDQDTLDALNATNDTIDKLKANVGGSLATLGATLATNLAPAVEKLSGFIGTLTERLRSLSPEQTEMILKVLAIIAAIGPVLTIGGKLIGMLGTVTSAVGAIVGVLGGPLTIAIGAVIAIGVLLYKNWDTVKAAALTVKDAVVEAWDNLKTKVSSAIDSVQAKIDTFKQKFDELKEKVQSVWNTIKGIMTGQISLPKIKLPHFKIEPDGWKIGDLLQGIKPSLSIDWYRKAYDNPVLFRSPTVVATPSGYKGFGDGNGAEIVMGLNKLQQLVGASGGVTINVYASDNMDVNQLADKIQARFVALQKQRRLAYA